MPSHHLVDTGEPLVIGGAFTDPKEIDRMRAAMRGRRHPKRTPRRYMPSLLAHRRPGRGRGR